LILRTPSCVQYIRLDGLHPSHLRGGWHIVSGANDVTGGGWCRRRGILRIICAAPHPALRATLPTKVGGIRKRGRHCEERTRRSNPAFLCVGSMDCFASARNDRTKLILRTPSCVQYIRLDGLHPSHLRGGWHIVSGANDVTGGVGAAGEVFCALYALPPTRRFAPPSPQKWEGKQERASLQQQVNSQLAAISERISARIVSISLRP